MSKDNVLKKDFQERDVQRLRNLIQGKYGEKTRSSVGFTTPQEFYSEGDIWESDGRTWTIKDGIKQNLTKFDKAKKLINDKIDISKEKKGKLFICLVNNK